MFTMWRGLCIITFCAAHCKFASSAGPSKWKADPSATKGLLYPFESESREVRSLDGVWRFLKEGQNEKNIGVQQKWFSNDLDKVRSTMAMPVPASYNDLTTEDSLRDHVGCVWYERKFFVSPDWALDRRIWLRFGSVHYAAIVWLNGKLVTHHEIGHLPFEAEVTDFLKFGEENRLTVVCNNTLTRSTVPQGDVAQLKTNTGNKTIQTYTFDFFNYAGIHRSVVLYTTPKVYIQDIRITTDVRVTLVNFDIDTSGNDTNYSHSNESLYDNSSMQGVVNFAVTLAGPKGANVSEGYSLHLQLRDSDGIVAQQRCENDPFSGTLIVDKPRLWWPYLMNAEYGHLYTLEAYLHLVEDDSLIDVYRFKIGIRKLEWDNTNLMINGKKVYLHGFGRHEDSELRGKGLDFALLTRDFNLLKWIGANAYRTSHYPYSEESMQFADENGIMIIDECPSVNTDYFGVQLQYNHKSSIEQLIHRDSNHPSVIMWSIANEPRTSKNDSEAYFKDIVRFTKTLDSTRPLTAAINVESDKDKLAQFLDVISFNRYNAWYHNPGQMDTIALSVKTEASTWNKKYQRPVLMSEYGADTMAGLHSLPETIWSEEYQQRLFSEHFKAFDFLRRSKWFIGEFVWNFADFNTEQTYTRVGGNKKGVFTRNRQPKTSAFLLRERYFSLSNQLYMTPMPKDIRPHVFDADYCPRDSTSVGLNCNDL